MWSKIITDPCRNIAITDINPKYVWGGDAITIDDSDMVWIDHVTVCKPIIPNYRVKRLTKMI